jgi:hypothetical protein
MWNSGRHRREEAEADAGFAYGLHKLSRGMHERQTPQHWSSRAQEFKPDQILRGKSNPTLSAAQADPKPSSNRTCISASRRFIGQQGALSQD